MKKEIQEIQNLLQKLSENNKTVELEFAQAPTPFIIGQPYLIRTVTHYYTGRVKAITGKFVQLEECCWIADTGRLAEATTNGSFSEVEPFGYNPWINIDSIIDLGVVKFKLPKTQK